MFQWLTRLFRWFIRLFRHTESQPTSGWGRRAQGNARLLHLFAVIDTEAKPKCGRVMNFPADELVLVGDKGGPRCPRCA